MFCFSGGCVWQTWLRPVWRGCVDSMKSIWFTFKIGCTFVLFISIFFIRRDEAASRPKGEFIPKTLAELNIDGVGVCGSDTLGNGGRFFTSNSNKANHQSSNTKFNNNHKNFESSNKNNLFNNKTNNNISNNNNNNNSHNQYNMFSSQQNLAKTNIIHSSNFARSRTYGSQQSLSTASNHSSSSSHRTNHNNNDLLLNFNSTSTNSGSSYGSSAGGGGGGVSGGGGLRANGSGHNSNQNNMLLNDISAIPTDVWLNAWNSPPPVTRAPSHVSSMAAPAAVAPYAAQSSHLTTTSSTSNRIHFSNLHNQNGHTNDPWTGEFYFHSFFSFFFKIIMIF